MAFGGSYWQILGLNIIFKKSYQQVFCSSASLVLGWFKEGEGQPKKRKKPSEKERTQKEKSRMKLTGTGKFCPSRSGKSPRK